MIDDPEVRLSQLFIQRQGLRFAFLGLHRTTIHVGYVEFVNLHLDLGIRRRLRDSLEQFAEHWPPCAVLLGLLRCGTIGRTRRIATLPAALARKGPIILR
jgi:hypothetical protein